MNLFMPDSVGWLPSESEQTATLATKQAMISIGLGSENSADVHPAKIVFNIRRILQQMAKSVAFTSVMQTKGIFVNYFTHIHNI